MQTNNTILNTDVGISHTNFIHDIKESNDYINIEYILKNNDLSLTNKQLKIENYIFNNWVDNLIDKISNKNIYQSNIGISILKDSFFSLDKTLEEYKNNKKYSTGKVYFNIIKLVNNNDIISIVLRNVVPKLYSKHDLIDQNITSLFEKIGKEIVNNICLKHYELYLQAVGGELKFSVSVDDDKTITLESNLNFKDFKTLFIKEFISLYYKKNEDEVKLLDYIDSLNYLIGGDLVEFISMNSNIYKMINQKGDDYKTYRSILPGSYLVDLLCQHMMYSNQKLPMIVKPNDWTLDDTNEVKDYGGYLINANNKHHLIHKSYKNMGTTKFVTSDNINSINYLQSVPFVINKELLTYLLHCINNNIAAPLLNHHLITHLHPDSKQLFYLNLKKKDILVKEILAYNSKYYEHKMNLSLAILLAEGDDIFYHPLFLDWRGRIYTNSTILSFQSSELSRSLIMFKDGVILNEKGIESLKIFLANCYGLNKLSLNERIQWTIDNQDNIMNCKTNFFWLRAKEPFLFLATCLEYNNVINDENYISRLPIYIDATCNGLQHLAAMTNDVNLAKYVNLLKSNDDLIPEDIYKEMANKVIKNIKTIIDDEGQPYTKLALLNINRSFIKRGIMTISYGSTIRGIYDQLIEGGSKQFDYVGIKNSKKMYSVIDMSICNRQILFDRKEIMKLSEIIHNVLFNSYPVLKNIVQYFIEINHLVYKLNLPMIWKTPSGLIIEQNYVQSKKKELIFSVLGKKKSITITKKNDKTNIRKQNLGIMPNIVHSMDASNIILLINSIRSLNNDIPILTIHDCFASNANNIELVSYYVKLAFLMIYKDSQFITNYHDFIINYLINNNIIFNEDQTGIILKPNKILLLPTKPILNNTLDLEDNILLSKYFVH